MHKLVSLKDINTFSVEAYCEEIINITQYNQLLSLNLPPNYKILGGGSNILITQNLHVPILLNQLKGIEAEYENKDSIQLKIASGENWHEVVLYCIEHDYGGIENLSLIPGTVGAAPVQNIGAYGVEIKDVLVSVDGIFLENNNHCTYNNEECEFGYRESIFKTKLKNSFFISSITIQLSKSNHQIQTEYGAIKSFLDSKKIYEPTIKDVSSAVIAIRQSKLPDPKILANAGSFFKNSVISQTEFENLYTKHPNIPHFLMNNAEVKIPTAWLLEKAGWKGRQIGNVACHKDQPLVIVNCNNASGTEIYNFSELIIQDIQDKFGVSLVREVNIW